MLALALAGGAILALKPSERSVEGRAVVVDGDTIQLDDLRIRLKGIDAPELQQTCARNGRSYRCGEEARRVLSDLVVRENVACRSLGRDRYQRMLARCFVGNRDIGGTMVERGWAVSYGSNYKREEENARTRAQGLWAGEFTMPRTWRDEHRGER